MGLPRVALALLAVALLLPGCVEFGFPLESGAQGVDMPPPPTPPVTRMDPRDRGDIILDPAQGGTAWASTLAPDGELAGWVADLNAELSLPYDVHVQHASCGEANAWYDPESRVVTICYELLDQVAASLARSGIDASERPRLLGSTWLFVVFHELGHGLVRAYSLPITGREEDAVDDLATVTLIRAGASDAAVDASIFWLVSDNGAATQEQYADEHSLNAQRFYETLCTVYGSDPDRYAWLAEEGVLPAARVARCPDEYAQKSTSWGALLGPWTKA